LGVFIFSPVEDFDAVGQPLRRVELDGAAEDSQLRLACSVQHGAHLIMREAHGLAALAEIAEITAKSLGGEPRDGREGGEG
jgi:hypothetical protein